MADIGQGHTRPREGFRFVYGGIKTNVVPDSLPPTKYPYASNIRALRDSSVRTRWGQKQLFATTSTPITDIGSYAALGTDNLPRFLARNSADAIYLDTGASVGTLVGSGASRGAAMIPFRPAESPTPWMYVANGSDYQKFSAPSPSNAVTQQNVGIAEPQTPPGAAGLTPNIVPLPANPAYAQAGNAGAVSNATRVTDTVQSVFSDPASANGYATLGVSSSQIYTRQMLISVAGSGATVQEVYPAQPVPIGIASIYYYAGTTGRCVVVPMGMGAGPGTDGASIYQQNLLGTITRGALIEFSGGSEVCYVQSVTVGPDGTTCFETSTTGTHTAAETFTCPQAIRISLSATGITTGQAITSPTVTFIIVGIGISTQTSTTSIGTPFTLSNLSFQQDDYIHFSINIQYLALLTEAKILFDVGDGSFTQNFYYYTVRQSDVENATQNTLTQLGAAQLVTQRAVIDEEKAAADNNQLNTASSAQTTPGDGQWAEIVFPISALTRVGNDQTKSLQTVTKMQFLFNMQNFTGFTYPVTVQIGEPTIFGGFSPDVGDSGAPYLYRVRPRSSLTGAVGNPSAATRYGVNPRRAEVIVTLPSAAYDSQIDTWDIFRYGGTVTSWRKIGQTASTNTTFLDNYDDYAALEGEELQFDNLQPWPSIDLPLSATATQVVGTTALVTIPSPTNVLRYLPGNLVRIGPINEYTLWTRPTLVTGTTYLFQFVENAGSQTGAMVYIYEPTIAQQRLPYMWGPDSAGTIFATGDPLRPGTLSFAKNYAPDAAPDSYDIEITSNSEPLLGGEVIDGLSFVASPERWWALYPQSNELQRYSVIQQPITRGLAAPFGHCNDGKSLYWWAKDGIYSSTQGSLTDADLSNLFPHDGVVGANVTYNGNTVYAPDYSRAGAFRLAYNNNFLYATYLDSTGQRRCLTLDLKRMAWVVDIYGALPTVFYQPPQQEGTVLSNSAAYPTLVMGCINGTVYTEADLTNDTNNTAPIQCVVCTMEWDGADSRASEQWGDMWLDSVPAALGSPNITVTPMSMGAPAASVVIIPVSSTRTQVPISLGGELLSDFLGMQLAWADDYTLQSVATSLQIWQPSFIPKPETIADRYTDWYDGGTEAAKWVQGFLLHADTLNVVKGLQCRDGDALALHAFTPSVQHNGESVRAYSFTSPFIAHSFRLEPTDQQPWRFFDAEWIFEPTPEVAETWQTQGTSFGFNGYSHIQRIVAAYAASAAVTLTITSFDGQSPSVITLPSTSGAYQKKLVVLTFNKGQLYFFAASSSVPFQFYLDDWEVLVGNWGRQGAYTTWKSLGSSHGVKAAI